MIQLFPHRFMLIAVTNMVSLIFCCNILKKYFPKFQDHLIPIFILGVSVLTSVVWCYFGAVEPHAPFYVFLGAIEGLATTGMHQTFKQIKRYIIYRRNLKYIEHDRRKNSRKIS